jgi:hypothetical protein
LTNNTMSSVPIKDESWEIRQDIFHENVDDILYINSLSQKDRDFIKKRIYEKIIKWEDISVGSVWKHFVEPKFKKLIQNPQFYNFYKRMLILAKQNFFIQNIEKYWDAVKWEEEKSFIIHPINNTKRLVNKILDN